MSGDTVHTLVWASDCDADWIGCEGAVACRLSASPVPAHGHRRAAQRDGDVLIANAVLMDAFNTDVRSLLAQLRTDMGLDPDPIAAYRRSGYAEAIRGQRVGGRQMGWG